MFRLISHWIVTINRRCLCRLTNVSNPTAQSIPICQPSSELFIFLFVLNICGEVLVMYAKLFVLGLQLWVYVTSLGLASNIFQNHFFPSEKNRIFLGRQKIVFSLVVNKTFDNWCKTWINNKETINIVCYGAIRQTLPTNRILLFFHLKHLNNTNGKQY